MILTGIAFRNILLFSAAFSLLMMPCRAGQKSLSDGYVGAGSCSASACHGAAATEPTEFPAVNPEAWKSAYTVWSRFDRHRLAASVLFGSRSKRIVGRLTGTESPDSDQAYRAFVADRCFDCHATGPQLETSESSQPETGVSCEACHGPAEKWKDSHYRNPKDSVRPLQLHDLTVRAEICIRCHVGPGVTHEPGHAEVSHELIAAGHPALRFEFSSYLAALPVHWDAESEIIGEPPRQEDYFAEVWSIGQRETRRGLASQLLRRLRTVSSAERTGSSRWPEFAEFDCFSCHHGVRPAPERRVETVSRGVFTWGVWGFASLQPNSGIPDSGTRNSGAGMSDHSLVLALNTLRQRLSQSGSRIPELIRETEALTERSGRIESGRFSQDHLFHWLLTPEPAGFRQWDDATQWFLAAQAAERSFVWSARKMPREPPELSELRAHLRTCRELLGFELATENTFNKTVIPHLLAESPQGFSPQAETFVSTVTDIQRLIEELKGLSGSHHQSHDPSNVRSPKLLNDADRKPDL